MTDKDLTFINEQINKVSNNTFVKCKISLISRFVENNKEVLQEIRQFSPADGWISLQSESAVRIKDASFDSKGQHILAGEFINRHNQSLSVRFSGDDWQIITTWENEEGEEVIKKESRQLSKLTLEQEKEIFINYTVYCKADKELGFRPYVSAFAGFSEDE